MVLSTARGCVCQPVNMKHFQLMLQKNSLFSKGKYVEMRTYAASRDAYMEAHVLDYPAVWLRGGGCNPQGRAEFSSTFFSLKQESGMHSIKNSTNCGPNDSFLYSCAITDCLKDARGCTVHGQNPEGHVLGFQGCQPFL